MSSQISAAVTYNARCGRSLLNAVLQSLGQGPSSPKPTLLFAFAPSSTTPPEVLSDIISALTQLYPKHVGCISAPLPHQHLHPNARRSPHSCSLAYGLLYGVSFRSTISGRAEAQVGRWHATRQRRAEGANGTIREDPQMRFTSDVSWPDDKINWEDVWDHTKYLATPSGHGNALGMETLPDALRNLDPLNIENILYLSDKSPERFATALGHAFPRANKLSLIASSTPFITGRPVTLFHDGSILSNGAVGIVLDSSPSSPSPAVELSFPPLVALSTNMNVTSSEGNLILSLDSGNPTRLLLSAIQNHGLFSSPTTWVGKEDEFYVGVIDPSSQQLSQLHRIIAGDPSRGAIALDAASAPKEDSIVRLYHLARDLVPDAPAYIPDNISHSISLFVAPETTPAETFGDEVAGGLVDDLAIFPNAFRAASENGFTLSRRAEGPWKCVVPGGRTGLSWNTT